MTLPSNEKRSSLSGKIGSRQSGSLDSKSFVLLRRCASLNNIDTKSNTLELVDFEWGDLPKIDTRPKNRRRRTMLTSGEFNDENKEEHHLSLLETELLDDCRHFPRESLRYLPMLVRESYAMRQSIPPTNIGNAKLSEIDLRLRLRRPRTLPYHRDVQGTILILDMSGFTALGERLRSKLGPREGAAEFAQRVNTILSSMVIQVRKHRGDVLMFAGDALICLFAEESNQNIHKEHTLERAKNCSLNVLGQVTTVSNGEITVHGGACHGRNRCYFLGRLSSRPGDCAFVVSGEPLRRAGMLLDAAGKGQIYIEGLGKAGFITEEEGKKVFGASDNETKSPDEIPICVTINKNTSFKEGVVKSSTMAPIENIDNFDIHPYARAYISKLQARRDDIESESAMSFLNNELRRVAIVFVGLRDLDNVDNTTENSIDLMNHCFVSLSHITHNCNGAVRDMLVDDKGCVFIAVFGAHSHELNPCFDATVCAMRMQSALKALKLKRFSLGVSFGDCFCGEVGPSFRSDFVVMGPEVNMAARLMGKSPNHGILVSKRVYTICNKYIQFTKTTSEIKVKGKKGSFHAYLPQSRKKRGQFVQREVQKSANHFVLMPSRKIIFDEISHSLRCSKEGIPQLVFFSSAPFLGKSKVIDEISKHAMKKLGFTKLQSFRTSLDSYTSYFPFRQITSVALQENASKLTRREINDDATAMAELINRKVLNKTDRVVLGSILPSLIDSQLMSLLKGQNPLALTKSIVESLLRILSPLQPLMMVYEGDGQFDPSSWSLLSELMKKSVTVCPNLFILVVFQDPPPIPNAAKNLRAEAKHVELHPFDENETEIFMKNFLGITDKDIEIDQKILDIVYERSNGCPAFMEYIITWALDKRMFEYTDGKILSLKTANENYEDVTTAIPRELSNIVLAKFNDLTPTLWDALKIASCVGYSFDAAVYGELKKLNLMPRIELLASKYDAFERCNGNRYKWKDQAVFESVKSLLMTQQRIHLHSVIVEAFETRGAFFASSPNLRDEVHRILARHCSLAEMWEAAFNQYMQAGSYAERTYKFSEAAKMYEEAIAGQTKFISEAPTSHQQRLLPRIKLGRCHKELANYKESEEILRDCLKEAEKDTEDGAGDEMVLVHSLTALAVLCQAQSQYSAAKKLYERALPISRQMQNSPSSLWLARIIAGYAETLRKAGDLPMAEKMHREALSIRDRAAEEQTCTELELAISYTQLGCTLFGMKQYEEAYGQHRSALYCRYRYLDFSHGLVSESLNYCAESLCALERPNDAIPLAIHAVEIRKLVFGLSHPAVAHALSVLASCYHKAGRSQDALIYLENCLQICETVFHKNHANNIPNLISYGEVLRATGSYEKSLQVYKKALTIHSLNFKDDQNVDQLKTCEGEVQELTLIIGDKPGNVSRVNTFRSMPIKLPNALAIPNVDVERFGNPIIISTDIGRDIDDEIAFVLLASLKRMSLLNPIAIVTTLSPQRERSYLARGSLDSLGMVDVPVGIGSSGGIHDGKSLEYYDGNYSRSCASICEDGHNLMVQALLASPPKSVQFLCIASLTDAAKLLNEEESLFWEKVKEVVVMGGLESFDSGKFVKPDSAYNNNCDMDAAKFVYMRCQKLGIPTVTVSRWAAYGSSVPTALLDNLAKTNHMVACNIRQVSESNLMELWKKVNLPVSDPRREKLPERCNRLWFCRTFMKKDEVDLEESIWSQVTKVNLYDPLALIACVPAFREIHFDWKTKFVEDTPHVVTGTSIHENGVKNSIALCDEIYSLLRVALKNSLEKI